MVLLNTPICDFDKKIIKFSLLSINNDIVDLNNFVGKKGTLIMFICNHCPYVKAIIKELVITTEVLETMGVNTIAIMSNDTKKYPEDSFENMKKFSKTYNFKFPYLYDEDQSVAKNYGAVCTPDFFGYDKDGALKYRGRFKELINLKLVKNAENELLDAFKEITEKFKPPKKQNPSIGCSIKWSD